MSWLYSLFIIVVGLNLCNVSAALESDLKMQQIGARVGGNCWTLRNGEDMFFITNGVVFRSDPRTQITAIEQESRSGTSLNGCVEGMLTSSRLVSAHAQHYERAINDGSDKYLSRDIGSARIFYDMKRSTLTWLSDDHVVSFNAESGFTKQKLNERVDESNIRLVAKLGSLVLLERQSGSMQLIAQVDSHTFYLAQCQECIWAVDTDLESIYALSVRDLAIHSKHSLDALIVAKVRYDHETRSSNGYNIKRSVLAAVQESGVTPEEGNHYLWVYAAISVVIVSSVLLVAMCVDKEKATGGKKKKSKVSKFSDSPGKQSNDSESTIGSVDFSLSRKDLISSRDGVTSDFPMTASPRRVYFPIDASQSGPATAASPMPQTVYSHFLPPGARSRMNVPFEDIKYVTEIGSGNFGKVYLAKWQALKVAVKVTVDDNAAKFQKELSLMLHLTPHPNVVQILGFSNDGFHPLIMMEFCRGGSLATQIKDPQVAFPIARIVRILFGVARGMLHLHKSNIVHRDLAARNVLLTKDGEPKLSDFGFSRLLKTTRGRSRDSIGPLFWMSPEAIRTGFFTKKLDVWSFGCVIYELLARQEPFEGEDLLATGFRIRDENLTPCVDELRCESEVLMSLMKQCWSVDPDERPDFQAVCDTLEKELSVYEPESYSPVQSVASLYRSTQ
eukprot:TRINITY_DN1332_c0_g1_i2.p1 TRINITY_DN1332_c0_g1~~TRINITY_DN1332_c0_g1_i2.p1  ORF type:complete len:673 (-),score=124.70 TRINITY_DN1332_c0_g1_i2:202-2220(-)